MLMDLLRPVASLAWFRATRADDAERGRVARQALEPIHCCVALSLLSAMPSGSKISIRDHEVSVQPASPIQGYHRSRNGDSFEDLTMLRRPLKAFATIHATATGDRKALLAEIMQTACKGLRRLVETYQAMSRSDAALITKFKAVRDLAELYSTYLQPSHASIEWCEAAPESECAYTESLQREFEPMWADADLQEVVTLLQLANGVEDSRRADAMVVPIQLLLDEKLNRLTEIITLYQRGGEE